MKNQNKTLTTAELAELLSVSTGRIRQIALSLGLERKGRDWLFTDEEVSQIMDHTRAGQNNKLIPVNGKVH